MELLNYVTRCKSAEGYERQKTLHGADNNSTFCGRELNGMWFVESPDGLSPKSVTCKKCKAVIDRRYKQQQVDSQSN